jgi:hypothetical protein
MTLLIHQILNARREQLREITSKLGCQRRFASQLSFSDELPELQSNVDEFRQFCEELSRLEVIELLSKRDILRYSELESKISSVFYLFLKFTVVRTGIPLFLQVLRICSSIPVLHRFFPVNKWLSFLIVVLGLRRFCDRSV